MSGFILCAIIRRHILHCGPCWPLNPSSDRVCCNALLAAYARAQPTQWCKALRLIELMWTCGGELCPDIVSYNTVVSGGGTCMERDEV